MDSVDLWELIEHETWQKTVEETVENWKLQKVPNLLKISYL